jgi:hypothetical protein
MRHRLRPLTPTLSRWEREYGTRVSIMSKKTYLVSPIRGEEMKGVHTE